MKFEGTSSYIATEDLKVAVNAAITLERPIIVKGEPGTGKTMLCLLYTSDAADDSLRVDLGGRRIIKKKKKKKIIINFFFFSSRRLHTIFFFFKQKTAYEIGVRLVGSEMCIRDSYCKRNFKFVFKKKGQTFVCPFLLSLIHI